MNYQTKNQELEKRQDVVLRNREDMQITGVKKLISLNANEFLVETSLGNMTIKGSNLEMEQLDIDNGTLGIKGNVYLIEYSNKPQKVKEKSFVSKLFK